MEYIDILDESGKPTGEKKSKKEVHEKGYWHRVVHLWLLNSRQELLIQKRSHEKDSYPD
jgi:isopentenyldiphosphate isomerase